MPITLNAIIAVFFGAGVGGVMRFFITHFAARNFGLAFPYGTLAANLLGPLILGMLIERWALHIQPNPTVRALLITGVLGGFTTFSAFTLETVNLLERQQTGLAVANIVLSVAGAILCLVLGMWLARQFN